MINFSFILSPAFALICSLMLSLSSLLVTQKYYLRNFNEVSLISFNAQVALWIIICCTFYILGMAFARKIYPHHKKNIRYSVISGTAYTGRYLKILLIICIVLNLFGVFQLLKSFGSIGFIKSLIGIGDVDLRLAVYYALKSVNTGWAIAFTVPVFCLAYTYIRVRRDKIIKSLSIILFLAHMVLILATQSKGPIFTLIISLATCELLLKYPKINFKGKDVLRYVSIGAILIIFFIFIQARRNPEVATLSGFVREIVAYSLVSYNRLAFLLDGRLEIPNMYSGFWTNRWFWGLPGENYYTSILSKLDFDIPYNAFDAWLDTFVSVGRAGLNPQYIWVTVFGEAYADYGYFGAIWFLFYGILSYIAYSGVTRGKFEFFALYPLLVQWNFGWYSGATVGTRSTLFCFIIIMFLQLKILRFNKRGKDKYESLSNHTIPQWD